MKNNKLKLIVVVMAVLPLLALSNLALAATCSSCPAGSSCYCDTLATGDTVTTINGTVTTINGVVVVPPVASPVAGIYSSTQSVTLTNSNALSIRYTIDGSTPNCSTTPVGIVYTSPISVSSSEVITAVSCYQGNYSSTPATFGYAITPVSTGGSTGGGGGAYVALTTNTNNPAWDSVNVGLSDLSIIASEWGQTGTGLSADLNHDNTVDILDFSILAANWNGQ
jgi:hypothetical protein